MVRGTALRNLNYDVSEPIPTNERLIVALDLPTVDDAARLVQRLGESVSFYKIGMQLQFVGGLELAKELINKGKKVFLDSKILDIDETVTRAVSGIADMGI